MQLDQARTDPFKHRMLFKHGAISHSVFVSGSGPGVILMHELPGMTPEFWRLANWLSEHFTVWAPDLFGKEETPTKPDRRKLLFRVCISREIHLFSTNDPGPITQWLRALSRKLHDQIGGSGVGVIGMCMTGNFSLTLALDPWVTAPVTSQPALPASIPFRRVDGALQLSEGDRALLAEKDIDIMALRFQGDALCTAARFAAIRKLVGDRRFHSHVVDDRHRAPNSPLKFPHSVLTADLVDEDNSETKKKLIEVIKFLSARLLPSA
ncbi:dienelactone hydrolase family protein [Parasphingorhabdus litoris]|uniref:Dienelactone hydrolase family protein n=1 Tax=Parasphingorhabdus litoris TaxID=394733 RepID=A0ABP3JVL1_9SPHN|nr:dienelactone hydrolase family protein [Parasphingorhabdus litoris]